MIKIYVVFRFSQTAEIHQKLSGDAFFGRHPPPATSWPRLQPTKSPRRPSPDPSTPTSTPTNKRNLLWLGAHGAVYICRNLPMVERVLKILKLKLFHPMHCSHMECGPKFFKMGTKWGPHFEWNGDLRQQKWGPNVQMGTKWGPKKHIFDKLTDEIRDFLRKKVFIECTVN